MDEFDKQIKNELDDFLTSKIHMTNREKNKVKSTIARRQKKSNKFLYYFSTLACVGLLVFFSIYAIGNYDSLTNSNPNNSNTPPDKQTANEVDLKKFFLPDQSIAEFKGEGNEFAEYTTLTKWISEQYVLVHEANGGTSIQRIFRIDDNKIEVIQEKGEVYEIVPPTLSELNKMKPLYTHLEQPLAKGAMFDGWEIIHTDAKLTTPYKEFSGVIVIEKEEEGGSITRKYFAQNYGEIKREIVIKDGDQESIITSSLADVNGEALHVTGYILHIEADRVLLAQNMTLEEYHQLKDLSLTELLSLESIPQLIYLDYEDANNFDKGDYVTATISGGIDTSLPAQAGASKIEKLDSFDPISIIKGYSQAVEKVMFAKLDDYNKFIDYANMAEAVAEFTPYMDESEIESFLERHFIYEQEDGLYIYGSDYIPMTFQEDVPYSLNKDSDTQYTLTQVQYSEFHESERTLTVTFHKKGDKWVMSPPKE
ncbi:DUF3221 domain-containing protein [Lederbergia graminis]|uniref:DUF3221 domain-containing protein n=1 Tax=Lederbergia graminis TaxID=735518 RepID=A0ABW0LKH9_9BACI